MFYFTHLLLPMIAVLAMVIFGKVTDWASAYMMVAAPHWIWAGISAYFESTKITTIGGFTGAHLLLIGICSVSLLTKSPEGANVWLLYFLGAPFAITLGAVITQRIASWKASVEQQGGGQ